MSGMRLQHIPTHLISGPLGAGKTSLLRHLLQQRPAEERWAILINEFGQVGLDVALLDNLDPDIGLSEVAGGCLCCVSGLPFQVGLGRLLRRQRPDRVFIEPSGLGHPARLRQQLQQAPWQGVLDLQPDVVVLDAAALCQGQPLPDSQQALVASAGLLVMNKSERLTAAQREQLALRFAPATLCWTEQGRLNLRQLPRSAPREDAPATPLPASTSLILPTTWKDPTQPILLHASGDGGWSIGWRWHPSQRFDTTAVHAWLGNLAWRRAKCVLHGDSGWKAGNGLHGELAPWTDSHWHQDSRLELIFAEPQDVEALDQGLQRCLAGDASPSGT